MNELAVIHHDDTPDLDPFDLARHAATLGDPSAYFLNLQTHVAIVTAHATGEPAFVVDDKGGLRTWDDYKAGKVGAHKLPEAEATPNRFHFGRAAKRAAVAPTGGASFGFQFGGAAV